jgi:hypothetical protein
MMGVFVAKIRIRYSILFVTSSTYSTETRLYRTGIQGFKKGLGKGQHFPPTKLKLKLKSGKCSSTGYRYIIMMYCMYSSRSHARLIFQRGHSLLTSDCCLRYL